MGTILYNPTYVKSQRCKRIYGNTKQISGSKGWGRTEGVQRGTRKPWAVMDTVTDSLVMMVSWLCTYVKI
jgi:hypothetical protein